MIPTRDRAPILARALRALARQTFPLEHVEVLVCDDGSSDDTVATTQEFAARAPFSLHLLRQEHRGPSAARNLGVRAAAGRVVLFINDDTIALPPLLAEHWSVYEARPGETGLAVLGRVTYSPELPPSLFAKLHLDGSYEQWEARGHFDWRSFCTCNVSVRRDFLLEHGFFDEELLYHEDLELGERLSHHGLRLVYNPKALGHHLHELREDDYLRYADRDGRELARWYRKSPGSAPRIAQVGLPIGVSALERLRHRLGDWLFNPLTFPIARAAARRLAGRNDTAARLLYRKLYQARKRSAVRRELARA